MLLLRGVISDNPNEEFLVSGGGDGTIKAWSLDQDDSGAVVEVFQLGEDDMESVLSLAIDGTFLISGTIYGRIKVWDLETRQMVRNVRTNVGDVLTLSIGGGCLFAAGSNGKAEVRSLRCFLAEANMF